MVLTFCGRHSSTLQSIVTLPQLSNKYNLGSHQPYSAARGGNNGGRGGRRPCYFLYRCANFLGFERFFQSFLHFLCNFWHFCSLLNGLENFSHIFCISVEHVRPHPPYRKLLLLNSTKFHLPHATYHIGSKLFLHWFTST